MSDMDLLISQVNKKILDYSGIYVAQSQLPILKTHIESKAASLKITPQKFCDSLKPRTPEFDAIINLVTVNETYFFREEKQFDFLKNEIFPKYVGKSMTLWTCCCATGEEPISLLALALSMNIKLTIYASDIDDNALAKLQSGRYSLYSLRSDGKKYHSLLEPYSTKTDSEIIFNRDFLNKIHHFKFNLIQDTQLPFFENADVIFMRNVFIYFDKETRIHVTKKVSERLKHNGVMFFSMNEIGSIDETIIPDSLYKTNSGVVYYFVKGAKPEKATAASKIALKRLEEAAKAREAEQKEKLRQQVEKAKNQKPYEKPFVSVNTFADTRKSPGFDVRRTYEDICLEINRCDYEKARTIARNIQGSDNKKYSFFMQGYIEYHADNKAAAETLFSSAKSLCSDFWPAFFYHGLVLRDIGKADLAKENFKQCKEILTQLQADNPYDFTLDSFSPSYIYSLCVTLGGKDELR